MLIHRTAEDVSLAGCSLLDDRVRVDFTNGATLTMSVDEAWSLFWSIGRVLPTTSGEVAIDASVFDCEECTDESPTQVSVKPISAAEAVCDVD